MAWRRRFPPPGRATDDGAESHRCRLTTRRDEQVFIDAPVGVSTVAAVAAVNNAAAAVVVAWLEVGWTGFDGDRDALSAS